MVFCKVFNIDFAHLVSWPLWKSLRIQWETNHPEFLLSCSLYSSGRQSVGKKNKIDPGSLQVVESAEKEVNMEMRVTDGEAGAIVSDAGRVQRPQPVTGVQKEHHRQNRGKGSETGKGSAL